MKFSHISKIPALFGPHRPLLVEAVGPWNLLPWPVPDCNDSHSSRRGFERHTLDSNVAPGNIHRLQMIFSSEISICFPGIFQQVTFDYWRVERYFSCQPWLTRSFPASRGSPTGPRPFLGAKSQVDLPLIPSRHAATGAKASNTWPVCSG